MIYRNVTREQLAEIVTLAVQKAMAAEPLPVAGRTLTAEQVPTAEPVPAAGERLVPVGISMRHVHLNRTDLARLFGASYVLTPMKPLSQPGQFAAEECVDVIGPKGVLKKVRILGPLRRETQIELAQTDCRVAGIKAPVRSSGDLKGTPGVTLKGPCGEITVSQGVIIADRHIHLSPVQAERYQLKDGDRVKVVIDSGSKQGVMGGVLIRTGSGCEMDFHIDTDDGNAFQLKQGQLVKILEKEE